MNCVDTIRNGVISLSNNSVLIARCSRQRLLMTNPCNSKFFGQVYRLIADHPLRMGKCYFTVLMGLMSSIECTVSPFDSDLTLRYLPSLVQNIVLTNRSESLRSGIIRDQNHLGEQCAVVVFDDIRMIQINIEHVLENQD
jgi:hypothetical protein